MEEFKVHLPILVNLRFVGMRDRHWARLSSTIGYNIRPTTDLSLQTLIHLDFGNKLDILKNIRSIAMKEYTVEKQLEGMMADWEQINLDLAPYK